MASAAAAMWIATRRLFDELDPAGRAEAAEIKTRIGEGAHHLLRFRASVLVSREIDDGLARCDHSRRPAHLAVEKNSAFLRERSDIALLVLDRVRSKLNNDLSGVRRSAESVRPLHDLIERLRGRKAREHHVDLRGNLRWRARRNAPDPLELGERAAAISQHAIPALDQIFTNRQPDLARADETDSFHLPAPP